LKNDGKFEKSFWSALYKLENQINLPIDKDNEPLEHVKLDEYKYHLSENFIYERICNIPFLKYFNDAFGRFNGSFFAKQLIFCKNKFLLALLACEKVSAIIRSNNSFAFTSTRSYFTLLRDLFESKNTYALLQNFSNTKKINKIIQKGTSNKFHFLGPTGTIIDYILRTPKNLILNNSFLQNRKIASKFLRNNLSFNKFDIIPYNLPNITFKNHSSIVSLHLKNNNIRLFNIHKFPNLKNLDISYNEITYICSKILNKNLPKVKILDISKNNIPAKNIKNLILNCPQILTLKFSKECSKIQGILLNKKSELLDLFNYNYDWNNSDWNNSKKKLSKFEEIPVSKTFDTCKRNGKYHIDYEFKRNPNNQNKTSP
jgi:hypothetical protein